jgi:hypothetical protein
MSMADDIRKYIAGIRRGQGPHISRRAVTESLENILRKAGEVP